jgi:ATP-dependent Clp protease ATP-binding subunit ClpC
LDEGFITDGLGRKINFKNCLIILTSNAGQRKLQEFGQGVGFTTSTKTDQVKIEGEIMLKKELQRTFSPEFLNRIDEIIYFENLAKDSIIKILDVELEKMRPRFEALGFKLKVSDELKSKIADSGFDTKYGARPLKRILQKYIEDTVAEMMVLNKIAEGSTVLLDYDAKKDEALQIPVKIKITKRRNKDDKG